MKLESESIQSMSFLTSSNTEQQSMSPTKDEYPSHETTPHTFDVPSKVENLVTVPPHPLEIKPLGNSYSGVRNIKSAAGLFSVLPDELVIQVVELLDATSLLRLGSSCKALYAFSRLEELWKTHFIESSPSVINWRGKWFSTYLNIPEKYLSHVCCKNLFSDALHRPFFCAHNALHPYASNIPFRNRITRLFDLSSDEFSSDWTNKPFILIDPIRKWPAFQKWSTTALLEKYSEIKFRAETVDWPLAAYVEYMNNNQDESPLYLFDRLFVEKMDIRFGKEEGGQYWTPRCFGEDLFESLGEQRPDSRWLIIGPERSGSTFHKDPNATSAWNAVVRGSKYWIMFPTSPSRPPPPGVFVSADQSEVTSPLSIAEWLLGFHAEARRIQGCLEGICHEGEVLHVPSGWWHLVVNLTPSIAITQNFVPHAHLVNVLLFLKDKPNQVSGFKSDVGNPYETFLKKMQGLHPEMMKEALAEMEKVEEGRKRKWDQLVEADSNEPGGSNSFSFGFGDGDGDGEDIP